LILHGDASVHLTSLRVNGRTLSASAGEYELKDGGSKLAIPVRTLFGPETDVAKIAIETAIDPAANAQLSGLYAHF
jgi:hypothetical protein